MDTAAPINIRDRLRDLNTKAYYLLVALSFVYRTSPTRSLKLAITLTALVAVLPLQDLLKSQRTLDIARWSKAALLTLALGSALWWVWSATAPQTGAAQKAENKAEQVAPPPATSASSNAAPPTGLMGWIASHVQELQALSGLGIVFLTLVLIILNGLYVRTNWTTMRLLNADVRFRLKPIPHVGVGTALPWDAPSGQTWIITIRTEHAPIVLTGLFIYFYIGGGKLFEYSHNLNNRSLNEHESYECKISIKMPGPAESWILDLHYRDLSGLLHYKTKFDANGFVDEGRPVDPRTAWNRLRIWWGNRRLKKTILSG